ncbi:MAG: 50S ribosomal protein L25/general stress protein Ctc [Paludibacteraceae bacterium]|nr:50S ribosomal protein L25/general stress protein Ctc [Paludibacteraceae bacterium]
MKTFELKGTKREGLGKKATKAVRNSDNIPCVLYGGSENVNFQVTTGDIRKLIYTPDIYLVSLTIDGKCVNAILKEIQFHPVTDKILHVDFLEVFAEKPIVIEVPVKLEGLAEGVKLGGKLSQDMRKIRVKGLYSNVPEKLTVNVEKLGIGKTIQIGALSFENLTILNNPINVVASVKATRGSKNNN